MSQLTKHNYTALILGAALFTFTPHVSAGTPLYKIDALKEISVNSCEPLDLKNIFEVTNLNLLKRPQPDIPFNEKQILADTPGVVIRATVLRERTLKSSFLDDKDQSDTGWGPPAEDPAAIFYFASANPKECANFTPGAKLTVTIDQLSECDTYPPRGFCFFRNHKIYIAGVEITLPNYKALAEECKKAVSVGCCLASVRAMEEGKYFQDTGKTFQETTCPDAYKPSMLKCPDSYRWCIPVKPPQQDKG